MKNYIYSQYDQKAEFFNKPMLSEIEPEGFAVNITRSIKLCRDPKQLSAIADCKLMFLGTFEDNDGSFELLEKPELLVECDKLIESLGYIHGSSEIN